MSIVQRTKKNSRKASSRGVHMHVRHRIDSERWHSCEVAWHHCLQTEPRPKCIQVPGNQTVIDVRKSVYWYFSQMWGSIQAIVNQVGSQIFPLSSFYSSFVEAQIWHISLWKSRVALNFCTVSIWMLNIFTASLAVPNVYRNYRKLIHGFLGYDSLIRQM